MSDGITDMENERRQELIDFFEYLISNEYAIINPVEDIVDEFIIFYSWRNINTIDA